MSEAQAAPRLRKWPFYLADLVLSAIAAYVLFRLGAIQGTTELAITLGCLATAAWGAWIAITPWLTEFRVQAALVESTSLKSSVQQIQNLEKVADLIRQSNAQWQGVQDASGRTVTAAREIAEKMRVETDEFMKFLDNAHNQERAGLRLEVDKLRKMEGDWIKVSVQMLDHVYALYRAAERSGQSGLIHQIAQFQSVCRDAARRMGLVPYIPEAGEKYDARGHQLPDAGTTPGETATVQEVLATGYTYQGQLLRRALVQVTNPAEPLPDEPVETTPDSASPEANLETEEETRAGAPRRARADEAADQNELPLV